MKKFRAAHRNYSTVEKEAFALLRALEHFFVYVGAVNQTTLVYTDHNPLTFVDRLRSTNKKLLRWSILLQEFNVEIGHIKGRENVIADTLSRSPIK